MSNSIKYLVAGVLLVLAFAAYQYFGTASLSVTSIPSEAKVYVDGQLKGVTPIDRIEVSSGRHLLEVKHSYFAPVKQDIRLSRGDHLNRGYELKTGKGTYEFMSNPRGAWVEVDGKRIAGRTPFKYESESGPHEIVMGDAERRTAKEVVVLNHSELKEVNFNLNIDPHGSVTFSLSPRNANVEFVGTDINYKPKMRIPIGEYPVRISRPGYVAQEFRYKVRYGNNLKSVSLKREYADIRVRATPSNAQISVSYNSGGSRTTKNYSGVLRVPTGQVQVRARSMGHRTRVKNIRVGSKGATVNFNLKPMTIKAGEVFSDSINSRLKGPEMIVVPAGQFRMGNENGPISENPVRTVYLTQPFAVSRYEITIGDFLNYANSSGFVMPRQVDLENVSYPMTNISHRDAVAYTDWLSGETGFPYRLLSEAEWEYVARSGTQDKFFFGNDDVDLCRYANVADKTMKTKFRDWSVLNCDDGYVRTSPVGSYATNPFGLFDIYGNVAEWVLDCGLPSYGRAPTDGSAVVEGVSCQNHSYRGGSWDSSPIESSSAYRNASSSRNNDRGMRVMKEL